ncbi:uncharacterized protein LOC110038811 isoform X2 [Phalaenopsis equestris]|uniref:uncharacterized protein LOC110038811 isoform X2 n=1 Tax=Phalaenopsis equestris TaxID=78828 RepID=UPI0009E622ED|nr:uncharacterized protein LOC110038811 isoform X2 [Phalaenopsis equestris]
MSIADKILLKRKLLRELAQARSLIERVEGALTREERNCKNPHNNDCSLMQKYIHTSRKRKSTEENEDLKNVDAATKVNHSDVSATKAKGSTCLKKISKDLKTSNTVQWDSKNSIRPQKKAGCSTRNRTEQKS